MPVTTDPEVISQALRVPPTDAMTVVFCTYHSLGLVERAQDDGAPPFDLILCDEAHRTTGIERPGDKTSPFVLVHDAERVRAFKRLYMTRHATPLHGRSAGKGRAPQRRSVLHGRPGDLWAGAPPPALLSGGRAEPVVGL